MIDEKTLRDWVSDGALVSMRSSSWEHGQGAELQITGRPDVVEICENHMLGIFSEIVMSSSAGVEDFEISQFSLSGGVVKAKVTYRINSGSYSWSDFVWSIDGYQRILGLIASIRNDLRNAGYVGEDVTAQLAIDVTPNSSNTKYVLQISEDAAPFSRDHMSELEKRVLTLSNKAFESLMSTLSSIGFLESLIVDETVYLSEDPCCSEDLFMEAGAVSALVTWEINQDALLGMFR